MSRLARAIKDMAVGATEYGKPVEIYTGTVVSTGPLEIFLDGNIPNLKEKELILTRAVLDHEVDIEVSHKTEDFELIEGKLTDIKKHNHEYKGRKKITIYNGLKEGEGVLLLRFQGGQKFIIWDRLTPHITEGEWL